MKSLITVDTKDYLCHSFLCSTSNQAEKILMALGQAFEGNPVVTSRVQKSADFLAFGFSSRFWSEI